MDSGLVDSLFSRVLRDSLTTGAERYPDFFGFDDDDEPDPVRGQRERAKDVPSAPELPRGNSKPGTGGECSHECP